MSKTIQVFDLKSFSSVSTLNETSSNGMFAVNQKFIAWPDDTKSGRVCLATISDFKVKCKINCHNSEINHLVFSNESDSSDFLITTSKKGTLIRLFNCLTGQLVTEFRRGYTQGNIVALDMNCGILCACTVTTIHIFFRSDFSQSRADSNSSERPSSILSTVLSFVPSALRKGDSESANEGQYMHLTVTPTGAPLACSVIDPKCIFVVMNNAYLVTYEISDDCKKLDMKNVIPLKFQQ